MSSSPEAFLANRTPLFPTPLIPLELGAVRAQGWLAGQLQLQIDGMTGQAERIIPDLGPDSAWRGGSGEDWEKGPYYMRGLVSLAFVSDDEAMKQQASQWVEAILDGQTTDGQIGPASNNDWWPRMVVTWALRDYQEATKDDRIVPALLRYATYMHANIADRPLELWAKARAADQIATFYWLYNRTGAEFLLALTDTLRAQANRWNQFFEDLMVVDDDFHPLHAVNISQAMKFLPVTFQRTGSEADRSRYRRGWNNLRDAHGLCFGMWSGTEALAGHSDSQGVEMCSIVEQMLTNSVAMQCTRDAWIGDEHEKIAFNLLPAGTTKDFKQFQYYTIPNIPTAKRNLKGDLPFRDDHGDDLMPSPHAGFHCCCYNLHMGWPKYVQYSWMATDDGGLALVSHGPTIVSTVLDGVAVGITARTEYPFEDDIQLALTIDTPKRFPLHIRVPGWCVAPTVRVNDLAMDAVVAGSFLVIDRTWSTGDAVTAHFPKAVATVDGANGAKTIWYGPLAFSLQIDEERQVVEERDGGCHDLELSAGTPWNYALELHAGTGDVQLTVQKAVMPANPWQPKTTPIRLHAKARRLPDWGLASNERLAADVPDGPVTSSEPQETINLVPVGTQTLRITAFPWLLGS